MATNNNNIGARSYQLQFKEMLQAVFQKRAYFGDFFGGGIEALDGVQDNENAFYVKTSDMTVVENNYNTDSDVAFGSGTANYTRCGERTEIIYTNTPLPYTCHCAILDDIDP